MLLFDRAGASENATLQLLFSSVLSGQQTRLCFYLSAFLDGNGNNLRDQTPPSTRLQKQEQV